MQTRFQGPFTVSNVNEGLSSSLPSGHFPGEVDGMLYITSLIASLPGRYTSQIFNEDAKTICHFAQNGT